jgi:putative sterol carrier protein
MLKFLSGEWFERVDEIRRRRGDIDIPDVFKETSLNLNLTLDNGSTKALNLSGGNYTLGHKEDALVTVSLPADLAKKIFIDADHDAGMEAFMTGQLDVEGDVTRLMLLQSVEPEGDLKDMLEEISSFTV